MIWRFTFSLAADNLAREQLVEALRGGGAAVAPEHPGDPDPARAASMIVRADNPVQGTVLLSLLSSSAAIAAVGAV